MKLNAKQEDRTLHVSFAEGMLTIRERERYMYNGYRNRWQETYITIKPDEAEKLAKFITEKVGQQ